jgi:hypothetical protein
MKREIIRDRTNEHGTREFCQLEIELRAHGEGVELSICGTAGYVLTEAEARRQALEYWESYFEDQPEERKAMAKRFGKRLRDARAAARFVLDSDGDYHGLDVVREEGGKVYVGHSFGQIREEIAEFFPEVVPYLRHHLNHLHAECEHQEARGETYETHPAATCPDCGWKLGHGWHRRELPPEVIAWARTFGAE